MLALCACATEPKALPQPLSVDLSALSTCETILKPVGFPPAKVGDDAPSAFVRDESALLAANGRIAAGGKCVRDVREKYSGGKAP